MPGFEPRRSIFAFLPAPDRIADLSLRLACHRSTLRIKMVLLLAVTALKPETRPFLLTTTTPDSLNIYEYLSFRNVRRNHAC